MKSMRKMIVCAFLGSLTLPLLAQAAVGYRLAVIDELQSAAKVVGGDPPLMFVKQTGNWLGTVDCPTEWAYFNAADNPHFVATLLAAGIADKVVRVYVDDALPKSGGHCAIKFVSLMPAT